MRNVARRTQTDGNGNQDTDDCRGTGHGQALDQALADVPPLGHEIRSREGEDEDEPAVETLGNPRPVDFNRADRCGQVQRRTKAE